MTTPHKQLDAAPLDELVNDLLAASGQLQPPIDAFRLADALCLPIARDTRQAGRARLARVRASVGERSRSCILLNDEPRQERRQWAVAHEIGEHLAPELFHRLGLDPRDDPQLREHVANRFANHLLLPGDWFSLHGSLVQWDLFELKQVFCTASHELIARRMLDFAPPVIVTIFDQGRTHWRRTNIAACAPRLSRQESACQQAAHQTGASAHESLPEATIRAWPIHESGWKREIVRTDVHCIF
jgi:hypothetical protein